MKSQWNDKILTASTADFEGLALEQFNFQYAHNPVYKEYSDSLGKDPAKVKSIAQVPFLPIRFFKSQVIQTTSFEPRVIFESSGTTTSINSRHFIKDTHLYKEIFSKGFEQFYGPASGWCIIGLLPSYLERKNSSLVFMVDELIRQSRHPASGFYLGDFDRLADVLNELEKQKQKTLLIGVTFALLDFSEKYMNGQSLRHTIIMETGGMKGRRKEMIREEVHAQLKKAFSVPMIHSEYGMTELLSQAWSKGNGIFQTPPWLKIMIRDEEDPFHIQTAGTGAINIIDLGNVYSCSFIATDDAGRVHADGSFEVIGRLDNSDLRGCSLLTV